MKVFTVIFTILLCLFANNIYAQHVEASAAEMSGLSSKVLEDIVAESLRKVNLLETNIATICNKKKSYAERMGAIELALALFLDESKTMEISYSYYEGGIEKCCKTLKKSIRSYLNRLLDKPTEVNIKYDEIEVNGGTSTFDKVDANTYKGSITFWQNYTEKNANGNDYKDKTKKEIEIILKILKQKLPDGAGFKESYDVRLGSISVKETITKK